jgi:aspartyl-tRNA(Asn)/glutamyl-tRNA(Gln) amidotransferase subunit A
MSQALSNFAAGPAASAEDAVSAALDRIAALNSRLRAFVEVTPERALASARCLDERARLGVPKGPLFGVPLAVKDVIDVAGSPTRGGSLTRADLPRAMRSASIVERLEAAGAVVVGKAATVEFAFGGWGTNEAVGTPVNPWDLSVHRTPGGSSSGSGVAVAAGLVPLALGTDTGGSVRLPAGFCGVVGLKTTAGLVDKTGVMTLVEALDTLGPLTRRVSEAALALSVMADPARLAGGDLGALARGDVPSPAGMRIGLCTDLGVPLHSCTQRILEKTLAALEDAGAIIVPVDLGRPLAQFASPCGHLLAVECYANFGHFADEEPNRLGPAVRARMLGGKRLSAPEYLATLADREAAKATVRRVFERVDAIVTPTTTMPAPSLDEHDEEVSPAVFTRFANYVDLAAVSVPGGLSDAGLPVGIQLSVPGLHEPRALALAAFVEAAAGGPLACPIAIAGVPAGG